jgi:transcription antitermination factor NusG
VPAADPNDRWFLVRTQSRRERWAAENVARAGATYYLPEVMETVRIVKRGVRSREFRTRPLFPCYLFVQTPNQQWHFLLRTFGVIAMVLGSNGGPGWIYDSELMALRAREENGVVKLPPASSKFSVKQPVRVMQGAYAGFVGLVQGNSATERVQILLDYMGRKVPFLVNEGALEAA